MHVPSIIKELLELTGDRQPQLAARLGVTQSTISKWLRGESQPATAQWDKISALYAKHKGWRVSLDEKVADLDTETLREVHEIIDRIVKIYFQTPRR